LTEYGGNKTNINSPESVTSIGNCAFAYCTNLTSINIPNSVTSIGNYAFYGCKSLKGVIIPDSVTSIGKCAFCNCSTLTSIGCYGLKTYKDLYFKATNGKMRCNGFQYKLGKTYKTDKAELCISGFHACRSPLDIFNYYSGNIGKDVRVFEVELKGVTGENDCDSKCVGTEITFLRELKISELAELASNSEVEE
jgi:hypothetical protein